MTSPEQKPVLILGAGINGAALARELVLNRVPVWIVDAADIAGGATSRSSRLIHGGLRYLEYGDVGLVRESLAERSRLRRLAPQFVRPLRLYVPVGRRVTGLFQSAYRFLGASRSRLFRWPGARLRTSVRGLWVVRVGLWMYDRLVRDPDFPNSAVHTAGETSVPRVDPARFHWLCSYSDAQMPYPERFVLALLEDARQLAAEHGVEFRVLTYHRAELHGDTVRLHRQCVGATGSASASRSQSHGSKALAEPVAPGASKVMGALAPLTPALSPRKAGGRGSKTMADGLQHGTAPAQTLHPLAIVNATGAWGDLTLGALRVPSRRLFGGTKGSHFLTHQPQLREALGDAGVYAEALDGRLVFILPLADAVLVGTTDERFEQPPEQAVASEHELEYLVGMVHELFPQVGLTTDDIALHYSGVRPLPHSHAGATGAISREHFIQTHTDTPLPLFTLVGGKLTTCRALGEQAADVVLNQLDRPRVADSRDRPIPGGRDYPATHSAVQREWERLAAAHRLTAEQVAALWSLYGNRVGEILADVGPLSDERLDGTEIPVDVVRWIIRHEWVATVGDLVERRLMLLYRRDLSEACLYQLAECLVEVGRLDATEIDAAVAECVARLQHVYGKRVRCGVSAAVGGRD